MRAPLMLTPSPGTSGQQQAAGTGEEQEPPVAREIDRALDDDQHRAEHADPQQAPQRLQTGEFVVEPRDHHETDAVQERREREQRGVGTGGELADDEVSDEHQPEQERDETEDAGGISAFEPSEASV